MGLAALDELAAIAIIVGTKHGNASYGALLPKKASALQAEGESAYLKHDQLVNASR
jgi:hypothetical protein